ncbi:putative 6,7-dimethyl-8-ribityllumazine synthase [Cardiosporidium cionae]|uniref:6,7-dimethyl-8-ribityllumazine synthase n=1 Tax=Cardiosporidium cionae TaxID=476202 RepID=A0ABQ7J6J5_9APIC|nr:putative 6,7-dimethyl-8-ribityllumazine synthase [Cardiosporidium cionae]|eukprot:KAF8819592.1 putative 6,7-dimethyl-8-ribityllumazine synthase [Cardiosporidium cionae]
MKLCIARHCNTLMGIKVCLKSLHSCCLLTLFSFFALNLSNVIGNHFSTSLNPLSTSQTPLNSNSNSNYPVMHLKARTNLRKYKMASNKIDPFSILPENCWGETKIFGARVDKYHSIDDADRNPHKRKFAFVSSSASNYPLQPPAFPFFYSNTMGNMMFSSSAALKEQMLPQLSTLSGEKENIPTTPLIGVVTAQWNYDVTGPLQKTVLKQLQEQGHSYCSREVSGAYEVPLMVKNLLVNDGCDAVIAIACLIKGETLHFEYIADAVSHGLMQVQLETSKPVIFGVLTCLTKEQALHRSVGEGDQASVWANTAIELADYYKNGTN